MLIPRPQYPLYSAALTMVGGRIVYYDMYEEMLADNKSLNRHAKQAKNCTYESWIGWIHVRHFLLLFWCPQTDFVT